ncbi:hypothetical protein O3P69_004589 [Scylla paramamosain]|uniref:Uncharacterized protein n=1 Tax=Scylla paramamosain TaxID=85552 RepID=A0AAW0UCN5_SCYPA
MSYSGLTAAPLRTLLMSSGHLAKDTGRRELSEGGAAENGERGGLRGGRKEAGWRRGGAGSVLRCQMQADKECRSGSLLGVQRTRPPKLLPPLVQP